MHVVSQSSTGDLKDHKSGMSEKPDRDARTSTNNSALSFTDILYCDRSNYFPYISQSPELAAASIYQIGGKNISLYILKQTRIISYVY